LDLNYLIDPYIISQVGVGSQNSSVHKYSGACLFVSLKSESPTVLIYNAQGRLGSHSNLGGCS
jgi:hypothetical protein